MKELSSFVDEDGFTWSLTNTGAILFRRKTNEGFSRGCERVTPFLIKAFGEAARYNDFKKLNIAQKLRIPELAQEPYQSELIRLTNGLHKKRGVRPYQQKRVDQSRHNIWCHIHYFIGQLYPLTPSEQTLKDNSAYKKVAETLNISEDKVIKDYKRLKAKERKEQSHINKEGIKEFIGVLGQTADFYKYKGMINLIDEIVSSSLKQGSSRETAYQNAASHFSITVEDVKRFVDPLI